MSLNALTQGGGTGGASASIFATGLSEADTVTATKDGKTVKGKWTQKENPAFRKLPAGYTQLSYIESTGTQIINSEYSNPSGFCVEAVMEWTSIAAGEWNPVIAACNSYGNGSGELIVRLTRDAAWGVGYDTKNKPSAVVATVNTPYSVKASVSSGNVFLSLDGNIICQATDTFAGTTRPLWIFAESYSDNSTIRYSRFRLEMLKLYANSTTVGEISNNLVRDYVPCKNPSGTIGLYDFVEDKFYGNVGTGTFIAGPEVPAFLYGHMLSIKYYGLWTVMATNGEDTAMQDVLVDAAVDLEIEMSYAVYYTMLYNEGEEFEDLTGGWSVDGCSADRAVYSGTKYDTYMHFETANTSAQILSTQKTFDAMGYSTIFSQAKLTTASVMAAAVDVTNAKGGTNNVVARLQTKSTSTQKHFSFAEVTWSVPVYVRGFAVQGGLDVYNVWFAKEDAYVELAKKVGVTATSVDEALAVSETILSDKTAVQFMVAYCTGDFMAWAIQSEVFLSALNASPYKSLVFANKHWKKFLAMVGVTA